MYHTRFVLKIILIFKTVKLLFKVIWVLLPIRSHIVFFFFLFEIVHII